jgi:hypothetical protein
MLPAIVITFGTVVIPIMLEALRLLVALPIHLMPSVRLCVGDNQRPAGSMVKVDMLRQFADADPGWTVAIIVLARAEVKIDAHVRIVVIVVPIRISIIVMGGVRACGRANDQQYGKGKQRSYAAHDGSPASFADVEPHEYVLVASPVFKAYDCIAECKLNGEVGERRIATNG